MTEFGKSTESRFTAITADVVASRASSERSKLQDQLVTATATVSRSLSRRLLAKVQVTAGDEVQALLDSPVAVVPLLQQLSDAIHPTQFAFGIGYGELTTPLPKDRRSRRLPLLDGPCFHHARSALARARDRETWAATAGFDPLEAPLDAMLELIGHLRLDWTEKQGTYAAAARSAAGKEVAEHFRVSPSVISESLKAANFGLIRSGEAGLVALFEHFLHVAGPGTNPHEPDAENSSR
ncbi:MAG: SatD family protein [bacterium]|nr:SatD family protein [bacterium]